MDNIDFKHTWQDRSGMIVEKDFPFCFPVYSLVINNNLLVEYFLCLHNNGSGWVVWIPARKIGDMRHHVGTFEFEEAKYVLINEYYRDLTNKTELSII